MRYSWNQAFAEQEETKCKMLSKETRLKNVLAAFVHHADIFRQVKEQDDAGLSCF